MLSIFEDFRRRRWSNPANETTGDFFSTLPVPSLLICALVGLGIAVTVPFAQAKPAPLIKIPAGNYRPLLPGKNEPKLLPVAKFRLERHPVTNEDFARFIQANPRWSPAQIVALFADKNYLKHWGKTGHSKADARKPVVNVSYSAARAYCEWRKARLPTTAEWEYVGAASETARSGRDDPTYNQRILEWYGRPAGDGPSRVVEQTAPNFFGIHDMHGLVWEWTSDFNSVLVTGESRGDSALERSLFCGGGSLGAADPSDYAAFMRTAFRSSLQGRYTSGGLSFRCARSTRK